MGNRHNHAIRPTFTRAITAIDKPSKIVISILAVSYLEKRWLKICIR